MQRVPSLPPFDSLLPHPPLAATHQAYIEPGPEARPPLPHNDLPREDELPLQHFAAQVLRVGVCLVLGGPSLLLGGPAGVGSSR